MTYLVPSSASKKANTCFGSLCNLEKQKGACQNIKRKSKQKLEIIKENAKKADKRSKMSLKGKSV